MSEWQPIETAPRNGSLVKLKNDLLSSEYLFFWNPKLKAWETKVMGVMGWRRGCWNDYCGKPTHWMPLPDPPT